jgi:hypothetical protein
LIFQVGRREGADEAEDISGFLLFLSFEWQLNRSESTDNTVGKNARKAVADLWF